MGHRNVPIKIVNAVSFCHTNYEGKVQLINQGKDVSLTNIYQATSLSIYWDSQPTIEATMAQNRDSYHNKVMRITK